MKRERIVRAQFDETGKLVQVLDDGSTKPFEHEADWSRFDAITDEDAEYNALMDPEEESFLTHRDREIKNRLVDPKKIRRRLKLTQVAFAERYAIPLGTLRDWERRARFPDSAARAYLQVISEDPEGVAKLLAKARERSADFAELISSPEPADTRQPHRKVA
jgi:putative transcriptional regulator